MIKYYLNLMKFKVYLEIQEMLQCQGALEISYRERKEHADIIVKTMPCYAIYSIYIY